MNEVISKKNIVIKLKKWLLNNSWSFSLLALILFLPMSSVAFCSKKDMEILGFFQQQLVKESMKTVSICSQNMNNYHNCVTQRGIALQAESLQAVKNLPLSDTCKKQSLYGMSNPYAPIPKPEWPY